MARRDPREMSAAAAAPRRNPGADIPASGRAMNPRSLDIHELLKREVFNSPGDPSDSHFEKNKPSPSGVFGAVDQYMTFDSFEKNQDSNTARGEFKFDFMVQGVTGGGRIGVRDKVDTVIEMQVQRFTIPLVDPVPYVTVAGAAATAAGLPVLTANAGAPADTDSLGSPLSQLPMRFVTMQLEQVGLQSISDNNGARHHFQFNAAYEYKQAPDNVTTPQRIVLTPEQNWENFTMGTTLQDIFGLTFVLRNPDIPISFPPDCLYGTTASVDAAAQLLTFNYPNHGLEADDRIFIRGFNSASGTINNYVGRLQGQIVGVGGLTADAFRLNPDVSTSLLGLALGAMIPTPTQITICVAKRRLWIPMRFRQVVPRLTNYSMFS